MAALMRLSDSTQEVNVCKTLKVVENIDCIIPASVKKQEYDTIISVIEKNNCIKIEENSKLTELQSLLLAKVGQILILQQYDTRGHFNSNSKTIH